MAGDGFWVGNPCFRVCPLPKVSRFRVLLPMLCPPPAILFYSVSYQTVAALPGFISAEAQPLHSSLTFSPPPAILFYPVSCQTVAVLPGFISAEGQPL